MSRLPQAPTQRINRDKKISFSYLGKNYSGFEGDTVAPALWSEGVRVYSRSLKYHRPRGLYSLDGESANTLMNINGVPNERAENKQLKPGMVVKAQNVDGDPESDFYGIIDKFDSMMPAGFYYKIFHKPYKMWPFFVERIRKMAGLGVLDTSKVYDASKRYELYLNAEVAVIGGGAAGMSAALAAAETGVRVVLFEQRPWLGGSYDWRVREHQGQPLFERAKALAEKVLAHKNIRTFVHAPVNGVWGDNLVTAFQVGTESDYFDERHIEVRANAVINACGCIERPLVFSHNERPGVMQPSCAWRMARTYGILAGNKAVCSVGDDLGLEAAVDLAGLGMKIVAVADARAEGHDPQLTDALMKAGIEFLPGWAASEVEGKNRVTGITLGAVAGGGTKHYDCDLVLASAGQSSVVGPLSTAKAKFKYCTHTCMFQPTVMPARTFTAGRMRGWTHPESIEQSGVVAGLEAVMACGQDVAKQYAEAKSKLESLPARAKGCGLVHGPNIGKGNKAFICFDEDGSYKAAKQSAAQGFDVPELAKRFGGFGLGPGQHQIPGQNLAMAMAEITGQPFEQAMCTTVRPPLVPTTFATFAGCNHTINKYTPLHDDQLKRGGIMRQAGVWKRVRYFSQDFTSKDEVQNVRTNVGLIDVSSLGKFRIYGPDAQKALQRVYIGNMAKIAEGKCKYGAMCNDTGNIVDDGVVAQMGENDYYFTTSSNRAGATVEWFRFHTRYDGWDYHLVNLTDALGAMNVAGPNARKVVQKVTDEDLSNEAFPYMTCRKVVLKNGCTVMMSRLGFVGELSYELHVPASYCQQVCDMLYEAGKEFNMKPFGMEAQSIMRGEKGHVIVGSESEQRTTLLDIGMGFCWAKKDFASKKVGAPALRACADQPGRFKLVGFKVDDPSKKPADGNILVDGKEITGFVCFTRYSHTLGYQFGMALVKDRLANEGGKITIYQNLGRGEMRCEATVIPPHFYDPEGERLNM